MVCTMLMVPAASTVVADDVFTGTKTLVLDDLVFGGRAGVVFRRLRVKAALDSSAREYYDKKRHEYLKTLLSEMVVDRSGLVIVGSHPTDVDLLDFDEVAAVRMDDDGLRKLSKQMYGDPVMLVLEYTSVLRMLEDAIDRWHHVLCWTDLSLVVMRKYPHRVTPPVGVPVSRQREILEQVFGHGEDVRVLLEDELFLQLPDKKLFMMADYDYLTVVRPKWRDAVVRLCGPAPSIEIVFRLPWFLVDASSLNSLCYRADASGMPAVSMRGQSLVSFVRDRLVDVYTTRELVGTWVGALLCDDITAVDTIEALGTLTIAPVASEVVAPTVGVCGDVRVPQEFAWMYVAVPGVSVVEWTGARCLDGTPIVVADELGDDVPSSLLVAQHYVSVKADVQRATSVVMLIQRLHAVPLTRVFLRELASHAERVVGETLYSGAYAPDLTPFLPGYNYLLYFSPAMRLAALDSLGSYPELRALMTYASTVLGVASGGVSENSLCAEAARLMVYSGKSAVSGAQESLVGAGPGPYDVGWCYLLAYQQQYHRDVAAELGPYPVLRDVMDPKRGHMRVHGVLDVVHVREHLLGDGSASPSDGLVLASRGVPRVLHFTTDAGDGTLSEYVASASSDAGVWDRAVVGADFSQLVSRQLDGVNPGGSSCKCTGLFVATIIGWTIVGMAVLAFLALLLYRRCAGGSPRGYRR